MSKKCLKCVFWKDFELHDIGVCHIDGKHIEADNKPCTLYISSKKVRPLDKIKLYNEDPDLQLDILSEEYDQLEKKLRNK